MYVRVDGGLGCRRNALSHHHRTDDKNRLKDDVITERAYTHNDVYYGHIEENAEREKNSFVAPTRTWKTVYVGDSYDEHDSLILKPRANEKGKKRKKTKIGIDDSVPDTKHDYRPYGECARALTNGVPPPD